MIIHSLKFGAVHGPCARPLTPQERTILLQRPDIYALGSFHGSYTQPTPHIEYYVTTNQDEFIRRRAQTYQANATELFESLVERAEP